MGRMEEEEAEESVGHSCEGLEDWAKVLEAVGRRQA